MNLYQLIIMANLREKDGTFFNCVKYVKEKIGHGVMTDIEIYAELENLEKLNWISSYDRMVENQKQTFYMLTDIGGRVYQEKLKKWKKIGMWLGTIH